MRIKTIELGEMLSLGISILIILFITSYLLMAVFQRGKNPHVPLEMRALGAVALNNGEYVIPITVRNRGEKTLTYVLISAEVPDTEKKEIELQYLPRQSSRTIYIYTKAPYETGDIVLDPIYYRVD